MWKPFISCMILNFCLVFFVGGVKNIFKNKMKSKMLWRQECKIKIRMKKRCNLVLGVQLCILKTSVHQNPGSKANASIFASTSVVESSGNVDTEIIVAQWKKPLVHLLPFIPWATILSSGSNSPHFRISAGAREKMLKSSWNGPSASDEQI